MKTKILPIIKGFLGYGWVAVFALCGITIFMNIGSWTDKIIKQQGVEILPKFDGGKIVAETLSDGYLELLHEPVRDGVFVKSKTTYIQIEWLSKEKLPERITDEIDYDRDGTVDVKVDIDTVNRKIVCIVLNDHITGLVDRSSLADFRMKADKANEDVLFFLHNRAYKETKYGEGLAIRLIVEP